jgi:adenylate cyclase
MNRIRRWAQKFGLGRSVCVLLLLALVGLRIWDPPPMEELRLRTFDTYQKLAPRSLMESSPAVILDIDEPSLSAFGQWPWPRTLIADVVTRLTKLGAAAVAFDIIFAEPDRVSPNLVAGTLAGLDDETREKLLRLPSNDQALASVMRKTRVVLGQSVVHVPDPQTQTRPPTSRLAMLGPDPSPFIWTGPGLVQNVPELEAASAGRGVLTIIPEHDGIVRRVPLILKAQGAIVPALTMDLLRVAGQQGAILVKTEITGVRSVGFRGLVLPTDRHGQVWVHFRRHDPQQFISVKDLLEDRVDPARIAGKLVFIGTSAVASTISSRRRSTARCRVSRSMRRSSKAR